MKPLHKLSLNLEAKKNVRASIRWSPTSQIQDNLRTRAFRMFVYLCKTKIVPPPKKQGGRGTLDNEKIARHTSQQRERGRFPV